MTERKPPGLNWESWIDRQIREANRKGLRGPPIVLRPFDVERIVRDWQSARTSRGAPGRPSR